MSYYSAGSPGTFKGIAGREGRTGTYDGLYYTAGAVATRPSGLGDFGGYGAIDPAAYQAFRAGGMTHEQATTAATAAPPKEDWTAVITATIGAVSNVIGATTAARDIKQAQHEQERAAQRAFETALAAQQGRGIINASIMPGTNQLSHNVAGGGGSTMAKLALPIGIGVALLAGVFFLRKK